MGTSVSAIITVTTPSLSTPPGPATGLTVSNVAVSSLTLSWTAPSVGTPTLFYQPQMQVVGGTGWTNIGNQITATSVAVTGLTANTAYVFEVITINQSGSSTSAQTAPVTTLSVAPAAPTGLAVAGTPSQTDINLQWQAPGTGTPPLTYQVYARSPTGVGSYASIGNVISATTEDIINLTTGTSYDFYVVAINNAGTSPPSTALINVSTASPAVVVPSAPLNVTFSNITTTAVQVNWDPPSSGTQPLQYTVQYKLH